MAKAYEELELKDDFMFSVIMRDPKYVKPFLETILRIKIAKIEYPEVQKNIDIAAGAKGIRLDVYVEDEKHTEFNLEMQTTTARNLPKRMRYYQGMIDINLLRKSMNYSKLKKCFVIFICTYDPFDKDSYVYSFRNTCKEYPEMELGDDTYKIFFNTKGKNGSISSEQKELLKYIQTSELPENCTDSLIKDLDYALQMARNNEEWRNDYMTLELMKQEQYEEGKQEGKHEAVA